MVDFRERIYRTTRLSLLLTLFLLMQSNSYGQLKYQPLTTSLADRVAIYAMMASNAYVRNDDHDLFDLEALGWKKVDTNGRTISNRTNSYSPKTTLGSIFSNLQYDIWEDLSSAESVIAFKGTDEWLDWPVSNLSAPLSVSYKSAKKHVAAYLTRHHDRKVVITGHSLGGGIALSVSLWLGVPAFAFNPSPRVFDGIKNTARDAERLVIFQHSDVLENFRRAHPTFARKVSYEQVIETQFSYGNRDAHRSDLMAEGLLACAEKPSLREFARNRGLTVACYIAEPDTSSRQQSGS